MWPLATQPSPHPCSASRRPHGPKHPVVASVRSSPGSRWLTPFQTGGLSPDLSEDWGPGRGRGLQVTSEGAGQSTPADGHRTQDPGWASISSEQLHSLASELGVQVNSGGPGLPGEGFLRQVRPEAHDPRGAGYGQGALGLHNQVRV